MKAKAQIPKKVLHIIHGFGAGGAETWLYQTVKYLKANPNFNLHFDFLATGGEKGLFDKEMEALGSKIFYIRYSLKNCLRFRQQFLRVLKENQYDAIHDHQDFISGWHYLLGLGQLPPVRVSHVHNPYNFVRNYVSSPWRWFSFRAGRILNVLLATKITGTSNAVMDEYGYHKWPYKKKRKSPVYCGFEVQDFQFKPGSKNKFCQEFGWDVNDSTIVLFIGRLDSEARAQVQNQKNPLFAFTLAKSIVAQDEKWKFVFVGQKGSFGDAMEAETFQSGLSDNIKFLGIRRDVPMILSASDLLLFPSLWEGLGMVAVEAQCNGLPVILSSTVPEEAIIVPELVKIKNLNDGLEAWAMAMAELAKYKPDDRIQYATYVMKSPFSIDQSISNLIKIYTENESR